MDIELGNTLWVEKFRPQTLEEMVLEDGVRAKLNKIINEKDCPHLLLVGAVGCGKTTIAKILMKSLECDALVLNASDERGIETIRNKVKAFAMMQSFKRWKIVFMDEADALTPDAQFSLRNIMETYSEYTRFVLTANYGTKIIAPIHSRCTGIEFRHLSEKQICKVLQGVLNSEKIKYELDDLLLLITEHYPDIRSMVNELQIGSHGGEFTYVKSDTSKTYYSFLELLMNGEIDHIRNLELDFGETLSKLFWSIVDLTDDYTIRIEATIMVSEHLRENNWTAFKEENFRTCCVKIMKLLGTKIKFRKKTEVKGK